MKRIATKIANRAQSPALIGTHDTLCRILYHLEVVTTCDVHDGIHLTSHASIVHRHNDPCSVGNGGLNFALINIHGIRANVHKHQLCARKYEGGGGAGEGKAGQNDLIARLQPTKQCSHIQCSGAAGRQKHLLRVEAFFHPSIAFFGKLAVSTDLMRRNGLLNIYLLTAGNWRNVEVDHGSFAPFVF